MKKFECTSCSHRKCTSILEDDLCSPPQSCVNKYVPLIPDWHEVKEAVADCNQLPDWIKECAIGYDNEQQRYFEVMNVSEKGVDIEYLYDGIGVTCSYTDMQNRSEARKRPFNDKEMQNLVGKVLETQDGIDLIFSFNKKLKKIETNYSYYDADFLIEGNFTIDGKPCYKLEHLNEKGEWVE